MFLRNNSLLKMKVNKLILPYSNFVKLQPLYDIKKIFINGIQLQSFSLGSRFFNDKNGDNASEVLFTGVEQIGALQGISKKKNQLSKVKEEDIELIDKLKKGDVMCLYKSPQEKLKQVILNDVKFGFSKAFHFVTKVKTESFNSTCFDNETDFLIIGGGVVGLSIAYAIRNEFPHGPKVTIVDKDSSFPHVSTNLGQGIVSLQMFTEEEEISLLKYGAEFFSAFTRNTEIQQHIKFNLCYDPLGSLLLADENNAEQIMKQNAKLQLLGINNNILSYEKIKKKFPWLNVENILFGSLGMFGEGIIDPWVYTYGLKYKCESLGVHFVKGEIIDFGFEKEVIRRAICKLPDDSYNFIDFAYCIIAGGLESLNIVKLLNQKDDFEYGLNLPLEERMRYEYCFFSPNGPGLNTPIVINPDGTYFRREGLTGHYVAGVPSIVNDDNVEKEPYQTFENVIKPFLLKRIPDLKKIDLVNGWIDVYDFCTSNKVGITGPHPSSDRIIFALGFSHLGLQLLPGLGRGVMEYLLHNTYKTVNLEPFHIENLWRKQHLEADKKKREFLEAQEQIALAK